MFVEMTTLRVFGGAASKTAICSSLVKPAWRGIAWIIRAPLGMLGEKKLRTSV